MNTDSNHPVLDYATPGSVDRRRKPLDPVPECVICGVFGLFYLSITIWAIEGEAVLVGLAGSIILLGRALQTTSPRKLRVGLVCLLSLLLITSFSVYHCPHANWYGWGIHPLFETGQQCGNAPRYQPWFFAW